MAVNGGCLGKELCDALGLDGVVSLEIRVAINEVAKATVVYYPNREGLMQTPAILRQYKLVPLNETAEGGNDGD